MDTTKQWLSFSCQKILWKLSENVSRIALQGDMPEIYSNRSTTTEIYNNGYNYLN